MHGDFLQANTPELAQEVELRGQRSSTFLVYLNDGFEGGETDFPRLGFRYFLHLDHRMSYALDLMDIGHYYTQYRRLMTHWQALYGPDILDFDYDAFVADPERSTRKLLTFCGLPWEDACLAFHQARTAVKTASVWQVRRPVYRESSGRWRRYERQLASLRRFLQQAGVETGG